jgi:hypothetical protein
MSSSTRAASLERPLRGNLMRIEPLAPLIGCYGGRSSRLVATVAENLGMKEGKHDSTRQLTMAVGSGCRPKKIAQFDRLSHGGSRAGVA